MMMIVSVTVEAEALVVDEYVAEETSKVEVTTETEIVSVCVAVEVEVEVLVVGEKVGEDASEEEAVGEMMGIVSVTIETVPDGDDEADSLVGDVELAELK